MLPWRTRGVVEQGGWISGEQAGSEWELRTGLDRDVFRGERQTLERGLATAEGLEEPPEWAERVAIAS